MGTIGTISLRQLKEAKDNITREDLANSYEFKSLLEGAAQAVLSRHHRQQKAKIETICDPSNPLTACTDNHRCLFNFGHPLFTESADGKAEIGIAEAAKRIYGANFHEIGHIVYTCFSELHAAINRFEAGKLPILTDLTGQQAKSYSEIESYLKDKNSPVRNLLCQIYARLSNCIEDGRMESLLIANDSAFAGLMEGLLIFREYHKQSSSRWDMTQNDIPTFMNLCLLYAKYHYVGNYTGDFEEFEESKPIINDLLLSTTAVEFSDGIVKLILNIWPKVKEILEENEANESQQSEESSESSEGSQASSDGGSGEKSEESEGNSSSSGSESSSNSNSTEVSEEVQKKLEEIMEEIQKRMGEDTENSQEDASESKAKENASSEGQESKENGSEGDASNSSLDGTINNVLNSVADDKARHDEKEKQNEEIKSLISAKGRGFANYSGTQITEQEPSPWAKSILSDVDSQIGSAVRKASREIERHFETDMRTRIAKNKYAGRKFYASKVVNRDYRYFGDKGRKRDVPKMKVGVVVDESGSMSDDDRFRYARAGAIALYEIFENISQMDIAIYGHSTRGNVDIFPYTDFGIKEKHVKEKLANIQARGGNIDVVPITVMAEKLLKENADIKLLFIITDGLPYSWVKDMTPEEELTKVADEYSRKGIEIIVAAMGEDRDRIKEIYKKQRFLDISSPADLPRELVSVIKRKL